LLLLVMMMKVEGDEEYCHHYQLKNKNSIVWELNLEPKAELIPSLYHALYLSTLISGA
jgi:hypothetical protein